MKPTTSFSPYLFVYLKHIRKWKFFFSALPLFSQVSAVEKLFLNRRDAESYATKVKKLLCAQALLYLFIGIASGYAGQTEIVVATDGTGKYKTIQEAIM